VSTQLLLVAAAGGLALALHARRAPGREARFALALVLGVGLARAGDALGFQDRSDLLLAASGGFSVLFVPLGPLALARWSAAFLSLPLPLALARLGCLPAGCCRGVGGEALPIFEAAGLVLLHALLGRAGGAPREVALFAVGFGALRLAQLPWRPGVPGDIAPEGIAALWLLGGLVALRPFPRGRAVTGE
jgi:hypothetical protein